MRYAQAFRFPFENERWVPNLLLLAVSNLVPLIGGIFALGYTSRVIESLRGGAPAGAYHDFDLEQAADYLMRGLRVFLVSLVLGLAFVPLYLIFVLVFVVGSSLGGALLGGADQSSAAGVAGGALGCLGLGVGVVLMLALAAAAMVLSVPLHLRAALHPSLGAAFSWSFVADFVRRCWRPALLAYLVFTLASIPIMLGGLLLLFVGVLVAVAYLQMVHAHLLAQLADLYEQRGGRSVAGAG